MKLSANNFIHIPFWARKRCLDFSYLYVCWTFGNDAKERITSNCVFVCFIRQIRNLIWFDVILSFASFPNKQIRKFDAYLFVWKWRKRKNHIKLRIIETMFVVFRDVYFGKIGQKSKPFGVLAASDVVWVLRGKRFKLHN